MNTASVDTSSTESACTDLSTEGENDAPRSDAAASVPPAPAPSESASPARDDPPIVRLVRTFDRPKPAKTSVATEAQSNPLPVAVLTNDAAFAAQVQTALDNVPAVTAVPSAEAAAALAADGRCAILVTDLVVTRSALETLTRELRAHDSALAIVVAGERDQGSMLVGLQSSGVVDGFLLKPITVAATQLVTEAATRRYRARGGAASTLHKLSTSTPAKPMPLRVAEDLESGDTIDVQGSPRSRVPLAATAHTPATRARAPIARPSWPLVMIVAALVAGGVWLWTSQRSSGVDPNAIVAKHLALAETALAAGRLLNPRDGAAHHFQTVLAIDSQNFAAQRGLDAVAREMSKRTQAHMEQQRFADAAVALARLRELQPDYPELPLLDSQLKRLQDALVASHSLDETTATTPAPKPEPPRERLAARAASRTPQAPPPAAPARNVEQRVTDAAPSGSGSRTNESASAIAPAPATIAETVPSIPEIERGAAQPRPAATDGLTAAIMPPTVRPSEIVPRETASPSSAIETPRAGSEPQVAPAPSTTSSEPQLVKYVPPRYPSDAHARQMEGWVEISIEITPNGDVLDPRIESGEKRQLFARAALSAVRQWKYAPDPTRALGQRSTVRVEFKLE